MSRRRAGGKVPAMSIRIDPEPSKNGSHAGGNGGGRGPDDVTRGTSPPNPAELAALKAENAALKAELAAWRAGPVADAEKRMPPREGRFTTWSGVEVPD